MIRKEIIDKYGEDRLEEILENPLDSEIHSFDPSKISWKPVPPMWETWDMPYRP